MDSDRVEYPYCTDCKVHHGFFNSAESVKKEVVDEVTRLTNLTGISKVVTTGHSLGGAMAHLTGMSLAVAGFNVSLQTFGAPRVGNAKFAEYSKKIIPI